MHPGRRPFHPRASAPDDRPQLVRTFERLDFEERPPQLERRVRVRPDRARDSVSTRELLRFGVEARKHAARVERFDGVHEREDLRQILPRPASLAEPVERMRYADERVLLPQAADRLPRRKPRRDLLRHVRGQDLPARRHDLLADDDPPGVETFRFQRAGDGVVIGHHDAVDSLPPRRRDQVRGAEEGVFGGGGVGVELYRKERFLRHNSLTKGFWGVYTAFTGYAKAIQSSIAE